MRGDFSRRPYEYVLRYLAAATGYNAVLEQQGRVPLDADWNEQRALDQYRLIVETRDIIGDCGGPEADEGFAITPTSDGKSLQIGLGRYYVGGMLCECLAPSAGATAVPLAQQPYLPHPPNRPSDYADITKLLTGAAGGIVYLDVWQQHLTALDDPLIREPALGGPDTTTRVRTVWQVKILPITSAQGPLTCDGDYAEWDNLLGSASTGLLTAQTKTPDDSGPCDIPPEAGYLRLENQLYRVEIHQGGPLGTATFKWSRENGSVVTGITPGSGGTTLNVLDSGPDDTLGFGNGQWAEVSDDYTDLYGQLNGKPGQLVQIDTATPGSTQITLLTALSATPDYTLHPKLRAWNQTSASATANGDVLTTSPGPQDLEGGITVTFAQGTYRTGDYWLIPARTATGDIEWPRDTAIPPNPLPLPPLGNQHAYCRLATVSLANGTLKTQDCRTKFPPLTAPASSVAQTKPAMHVYEIGWVNDEYYSFTSLWKPGLQIVFDMPPDMNSLKADTMIVTLEIPWVPLDPTHVTQVSGQPEISIILAGTIQPYPAAGVQPPTGIQWNATNDTALVVQQYIRQAQSLPLRVRVMLKGHDIWPLQQLEPREPASTVVAAGAPPSVVAAGARPGMLVARVPQLSPVPVPPIPRPPFPRPPIPRPVVGQTVALHLDGQAFGEPATGRNGKPRIDLHLPSGDGMSASDFESWFYINLQGEIPPVQTQAANQTMNQPAPGTFTVNPAVNPVVNPAVNPDIAQMPRG